MRLCDHEIDTMILHKENGIVTQFFIMYYVIVFYFICLQCPSWCGHFKLFKLSLYPSFLYTYDLTLTGCKIKRGKLLVEEYLGYEDVISTHGSFVRICCVSDVPTVLEVDGCLQFVVQGAARLLDELF